MSTQRKLRKSIQKLPPVVIVPDASYIDDTGYLITTDVIVLTNPEFHEKVSAAINDERGHRKDIVPAKMRRIII